MSLAVDHLTKKYGRQLAVNAVSFEARPGEILGFLGPNGAGKSTTMKIATGYLPPSSGRVSVCGLDVVEDSLEVRKKVGYLPEHNPLYLDMYVREYLQFAASLYRLRGRRLRERVDEMISRCGLEPERHKLIASLSKGYRQRVGLAQALIHDPEVLILDEPTTGLDPNQLAEIRALIRNISAQKTVVLSTHIMQEVQALCDRVIIINRGNIVIDSSMQDLQKKQPGTADGQLIEVEFTEALPPLLLESISGVEHVSKTGDRKYLLSAEAGADDLRAKVFRFAAENGHVLLEMHTAESTTLSEYGNSLEEIFRNLTLSQS
jgi:ABC-2 type transport system ATP-binding protein